MQDLHDDILLKEDVETAKKIGRALWWVEHREQLGNIGVIFLIVFDTCLLLFVVWSFVDAFLISAQGEQRSLIEMVSNNQEDLRAYTSARAATPISVSDAHTFFLSENKYDFYAELENQNTDWWAEFNYQFVFDGGSTDVRHGFILPNSKKPIAELAYVSKGDVGKSEFQFQTISWHRINHHTIPDYAKWSQDRLGIEIINPMILQDTSINTHALFRTTFTVKNNTAFHYQNPAFYLLLKRGTTVLGVNKTQIQSLEAGESQDIVVNWFGSVPSVSQIEILPDLNIFDPMLYKAAQGTESIDTRTISP